MEKSDNFTINPPPLDWVITLLQIAPTNPYVLPLDVDPMTQIDLHRKKAASGFHFGLPFSCFFRILNLIFGVKLKGSLFLKFKSRGSIYIHEGGTHELVFIYTRATARIISDRGMFFTFNLEKEDYTFSFHFVED